MQHDWLEVEEEQAEIAARRPPDPIEESGFVSIGGGVRRAVTIAGAKFAIAPDCESPIEAMLGGRLKLLVDGWNTAREPKLTLVPQYQLQRFCYDFAILCGETLVMAIECDGKEFHSSEAARANDKAKTAAIHAAGAEMQRFSGSHIFRWESDCAAFVGECLNRKFGQA